MLIGVLYVVLALVVVVGFVGDVGPLDVPGLLIATLMIALALLGVRWSERRGERKRLVHAHGLSAYDARMAMHLVDSGQVMRGALRPAGRDYAQRQLDRGPTPVWVPALGVVMAVAVYLPYAALPGTRVFTLVGIGFVGFRCQHTYTRPTRLRSVLENLTSTTAPGLPTQSEALRKFPAATRAPTSAFAISAATSDTAPRSAAHPSSSNAALTALITLRRPRAFRNSLSEYIVDIDGHLAGRLRSRASEEYAVQPGQHDIRVRLDTILAPEMGYVGSPAFEVDLGDGERLEVDVIALPASYTNFGVRHTTADPEGWLMLAPAGADKPPSRTVRALIRALVGQRHRAPPQRHHCYLSTFRGGTEQETVSWSQNCGRSASGGPPVSDASQCYTPSQLGPKGSATGTPPVVWPISCWR